MRAHWPMRMVGLLLVTTLGGCGAGEPGRCEAVIERMAQCYPDLAMEASCTAATVAEFDRLNLVGASCPAIGELGKADAFALGGCGAGEHVCGWIFCCRDYTITRLADGQDWGIVPAIQTFQAAVPGDVEAAFMQATEAELEAGVSFGYSQTIVEQSGRPAREMAVELTSRLIRVPYDQYVTIAPPHRWGRLLAHYLGGEVRVYDAGAGRPAAQVERMVLSALPCDFETPLLNHDMTKLEVIDYTDYSATVFWRVYYSDNGSTEADVGSVDFRAYGADATLVTFHSAHRLNAPGGIHLASAIVLPALTRTFRDHLEAYRRFVEGS